MISSAVLQWIAAATMVIDHLGLYLLSGTTAYVPMRMIGRIALPLYVFMLVEGFQHTRDKHKYFLRLLIFAFIAQLPVDILNWQMGLDWQLNIMFNLTAALVALSLTKRGSWGWLGVAGLALLTQISRMDYGASVIIMAVGFYLCGRQFKKEEDWLPRKIGYAVVLLICTVFLLLTKNWYIQIMELLAIIPIMLYGGKKGARMPRYFFYVFYPLHLIAIILIKLALM